MYALYVKTFFSTRKKETKQNKKNTHSHLADFDSLQSLLSAYLTSLLPSSLTDYPLFSVYCTTVQRLKWTPKLDQDGIASTPVLVGANLMM